MAENTTIDFDEMSFQQKKDLIIKLLLKACNFTDLSATILDWTSSLSGIFVPEQWFQVYYFRLILIESVVNLLVKNQLGNV